MSQWHQKPLNLLETCWQFIVHLTRRFFRDDCPESAAALTYMTLFALVPMLTLMFATFSLFPDFRGLEAKLQSLIFSNFLPEAGSDSDTGVRVQEYLTGFMDQARKLSAVGIGVLIVTSYLMLANIEKTFNKIWGTAGGRKGLSSFLLYWAILSLGPVLLGVGLSINAYGVIDRFLLEDSGSPQVGATLLQILPFLFAWAAATLLFVAVPNCRVQIRFALFGGLVTVLLFEGLKNGFSWVVANTSYQEVYGTFAVVPLFLLWIYLIWTLVLLGAELVRGLETFKTSVRGYSYPNLVAALMIFSEAAKQQRQGETISDHHMLQAGVDQLHWQQLRDLFLGEQILVSTANNRYVLARELSSLKMAEVVNLFGEHFATEPSAGAWTVLERYPWSSQLRQLLDNFHNQSAPLLDKTVAELLQEGQ
ncbi:YihY family inner membrane protein [Porticoccus sp. W117]|uniref:YihY family inner membrane protein n=1 Tax=Porticoccus sp. W117 TaxID=3054777 RepID=UPI0025953379|nr:YihY family inner membrane protein [Porticoccus sp. W117]MDM3870106.1 YihY family inner membrane protein [Porticoccus sp. W117]